jgi:hypothetical protein
MSMMRRVGIVLSSSIIGALLAVALTFANTTGVFITWVSLGKPPEPATKILAITNGLWVQSASGVIYQYSRLNDCKEPCWVMDANPVPDPAPVFPLSACGQVPAYIGAKDQKASCSPWGPSVYLSVYAIDNAGIVHSWGHGVTEYDSMLLLASPIIGVLAGFVIGIGVVTSQSHRREE